jgi:hypothetical protein
MMDNDTNDTAVELVLVRATAKGYFGKVIEPDQGKDSEFYVPEGTTGSWFEVVEKDESPEPRKGKGKKADLDVI